MTDSNGFEGCRPGGIGGPFCQSLFEAMSTPLLLRSSRVGSARALGTPCAVRLGPRPRTAIVSLPLWLPRMKPAMTTLLPVLTKARVLMLASFAGTAWLRSYTSTKPTPEVLFLPLMMAV